MLFKTSDELKKYLPANAAFEFEQIKPFLQFQVEPEISRAVLGTTEYNNLDTAYGNNTLSANQEKLLEKVRFPIANYAYSLYIPFAQLSISASGIHIEVNDQKKTAFQWQINMLKKSCLDAADNGIEQLLEFMETPSGVYTDWEASAAFTVFKECFINTAREFSLYYNIKSSRRLFLAFKHIMQRMEDLKIKSILCSTLFDQIKTQINAGTLTNLNKDLLKYIRPAVANHTIARVLAELDVNVTPEGVSMLSTSSTLTEEVKTPAEITRISALKLSLEADGDDYLKQLSDYLYAHADDYPDWKSSSCYIDPDSDAAQPPDQTSSGIVFF